MKAFKRFHLFFQLEKNIFIVHDGVDPECIYVNGNDF